MQQQQQLHSLEDNFRAAALNDKHPLHLKAVKFAQYTRELLTSPSGAEWFQMLCAFGAHPFNHSPSTTGHEHGRSEVTSFLLRRSSDSPIPELNPTIQTNGQHHQTRTRAPRSRSGDATS